MVIYNIENEMNYIYMKQNDIKKLKEKIWEENNKQCPVLKKDISLDKMVLDHAHKLKNELPTDNKGTIREALEFRVNAFFGKIENSYKRYGLHNEIDLVTLLRRGADYLERGDYIDENGNKYIHPNEVPREKKLRKRVFNKINKLYITENPKRKPLQYPKSSKVTKQIRELAEKYSIDLE